LFAVSGVVLLVPVTATGVVLRCPSLLLLLLGGGVVAPFGFMAASCDPF
jgi:hypothetical protein